MADKKVTELSSKTSIAADDLLHLVDMSGSPVNKKAVISDVVNNFKTTDAENTAGVTPTNFHYPEGDVRRYGANTTPGTTDMTAIINNAISVANAAGGGTVWLEPGVVHAVDPSVSPIIMKSNVTLDLRGATIKRIGTSTTQRMLENDDYALSSTDSNIHVISTGEPGKFIGTGDTEGVSDQGAAIGWFGLNGPWSIRNIDTDKSNGDGISYRNVGLGVLQDITINEYGRNGISPTSTQDRVAWYNVNVIGPATAGANPGIGIDAENDSASESTDHVWYGVKSAKGMTFVDFYASSTFSHKLMATCCECGPAFQAFKVKSTSNTTANDFIISNSLIKGSGASGGCVNIDNVNGVRMADVTLDVSAATGSPVGVDADNDVDDLNLDGVKVVGTASGGGIQAFTASDVMTNAKIYNCDFGPVYLTGNDNEFYNCDITTLTLSRAASIDNKFIHSTPTSITEANSADKTLNQIYGDDGLGTAAADDTTPTVAGLRTLVLPANTGATAITQLDNAVDGQVVTLVCNSSTNSPTIADSGNFALSAAWTPAQHDTLTVVSAGAVWREVSRSTN
jgi:hypothetical protein